MRIDRQGWSETCCECMNPGPGIQVFFFFFISFFSFLSFHSLFSNKTIKSHFFFFKFCPVDHEDFLFDPHRIRVANPLPTWQPYSLMKVISCLNI